MKITQKIEKSSKEDKIWWSFEYFPPRTAQVCTFHLTFSYYDSQATSRACKICSIALSACALWGPSS